jgi:tripartite-type tricarboxylate transporter receptor subunit TctC
MRMIRWFTILVAAAMSSAWLAPAASQNFPSRPIRLLVPFPPGGASDQVSRLLGQKITESTGQAVIVDNRPGGGAQIAATALMQAPADGYSLLIGDIGAFAINTSLYQNLSFNPQRDFQPISLVMSSPMVLLVPTKSTANSVSELLEIPKRGAGHLSYASQGIGTGGHLLAEMFKSASNAPLVHVPYKGGAPAMQDLVAGQVDLLFDAMGVAVPQARGGKARILAVAAPQRSPRAPDVPTMAEAGYPNVLMTVWFGIVARAGTPEPLVRRLNSEIVSALNSPDVSKRLNDQGFDPSPSTAEEFAARIRDETAKWSVVVKASGARVD